MQFDHSMAPALRRPLVLASVMAAIFTIAVEATIVSTAMPQIVAQLGDLHLYTWVFSAFLLTQTATTVVFGKLADTYGRRPVLLVGIVVFLVGSLLCGFSWSMGSLIAFRLVQGVGAGAIQPVALTVVGDLYSVEERARIQGYLASVWGISSVLGPLAGGLIVKYLSWSWIFWINLPIGVLAMAGLMAFLHERVERERRAVDVLGAGLFAGAVASLMLALAELGTSGRLAWMGAGVFVVLAGLFVWQERRAVDPMVHIGLWARRPIATANLATLLSGMAIIGLTTFVPMYVQGVLGQSALVAGFALTAMVLGWPIGATLAARNFARFGIRRTALAGACLLPVGAVAFVVLGPGMSPLVPGIGSAVMGLGMGLLSTSAIVLIQDVVDWSERGVATASNIFSRNLGSTLGATALGSVLNLGLANGGSWSGSGQPAVTSEQVRQLLEGVGDTVFVRLALAQSLHWTFVAVFVVAVGTLALTTLMPQVSFRKGPREAAAE